MRRFLPTLMASLFFSIGFANAWAQEPEQGKSVPAKPQAPRRIKDYASSQIPSAEEAAIKPTPLEPFPDDPLPHEGAMIKVTHRIQPPDEIFIEVLQALPGRPITGKHLVRGDGKVSLGFYGDVEVAGLTIKEAKIKITLHLHQYLIDSALGLSVYREVGGPVPPLPPPGTIVDHDFSIEDEPLDQFLLAGNDPSLRLLYALLTPIPTNPPSATNADKESFSPKIDAVPRIPNPGRSVVSQEGVDDEAGKTIYIAPEDTPYVFVDVAQYNTGIYYSSGEFNRPSRQFWRGNETVLDVINYSSGLKSPDDRVWLHRPARGGKPKRSYRIDLDAINQGDQTANLQILPGDRLVACTPEEDRKLGAALAAK